MKILFDCFGIEEGAGKSESLLVIGDAGGSGSIIVQVAKKFTSLIVIASASRPETIEWVEKMGAGHVINHRESLADRCERLGLTPRYVASFNGTEGHVSGIVGLIKPRGHIGLIDDQKSLDLHYRRLNNLK